MLQLRVDISTIEALLVEAKSRKEQLMQKEALLDSIRKRICEMNESGDTGAEKASYFFKYSMIGRLAMRYFDMS